MASKMASGSGQLEADFPPPGTNGRRWWWPLAFPAVALVGEVVDALSLDTPSVRKYSVGFVVFGAFVRLLIWVVPTFVSGGKRTRWQNRYAPAQWAADPAKIHSLRYWDGFDWTSSAVDGGVEVDDPIDAALGTGSRAFSVRRGKARGPWWALLSVPLALMMVSVVAELAQHSTHPLHGGSRALAGVVNITAAFGYLIPSFVSGSRREAERQAEALNDLAVIGGDS